MPNKIDRRDLDDISFVDSEELQSSGSGDVYRRQVWIVSTTGSSKQVRTSGWDLINGDDDDFLQVGDIFILSGSVSSPTDGTYTVASIVNTGTFTVNETISDSILGSGTFKHPVGASRIGFNSNGFTSPTGSNLQDFVKDLAGKTVSLSASVVAAISSGSSPLDQQNWILNVAGGFVYTGDAVLVIKV